MSPLKKFLHAYKWLNYGSYIVVCLVTEEIKGEATKISWSTFNMWFMDSCGEQELGSIFNKIGKKGFQKI